MSKYRIVCCLIISVLFVVPQLLANQFIKVSDHTTEIPGRSGETFTRVSFPSIDGGYIAYIGKSDTWSGVYKQKVGELDGIEIIADQNSLVPGGIGTFTNFSSYRSDVAFDDGMLAFIAESSDRLGVYTEINGVIRNVADSLTFVPNKNTLFEEFTEMWTCNENTVFIGKSGDLTGIYTNFGGNLHKIVDNTDTIPGGVEVFKTFQGISMEGKKIAFTAEYGNSSSITGNGVFLYDGDHIVLIADTNTQSPNNTGLFTKLKASFSAGLDVLIDHHPELHEEGHHEEEIQENDGVYFRAYDGLNKPGIFKWENGDLTTVLDSSTPIRDYPGETFENIRTMGMNNGKFTFLARGKQYSSGPADGIYMYHDGEISTIINNVQLINGQTHGSLGTYSWGIEYDIITFNVVNHFKSVDIYNANYIVTLDADNDGILDSVDNCPLQPHEDTNDFDNDGIGDICDQDAKGKLVIKEANIDWKKKEIKIKGKLVIPDGYLRESIQEIGYSKIMYSEHKIYTQNHQFKKKGRNEEKWEFKDKNALHNSFSKIKLKWKESKFKYQSSDFKLETHTSKQNETILHLNIKKSKTPTVITVTDDGVIIGEFVFDKKRKNIKLPFQLKSHMKIRITRNSLNEEINLNDYLKNKHIEFEFKGEVDREISNQIEGFMFGFSLGTEGYKIYGYEVLDDTITWEKKKKHHWKYKSVK